MDVNVNVNVCFANYGVTLLWALLSLHHLEPATSFAEKPPLVQRSNSNALPHIGCFSRHIHRARTPQPLPFSRPSTFSITAVHSSNDNDELDYNIVSMDDFMSVHPNTSDDKDYNSVPISEEEEVTVEIVYENKSYQLKAFMGESILSALERNRASSSRLPLPPIPHDCRKGSCMTCSGRVLCATSNSNSNNSATPATESRASTSSLMRGDDGLNPSLSKQVELEGYLLTCSSFVVGPGLKIEIGCKEEVWNLTYKDRMTGNSETIIRTAAAAKAMRLASEKDIAKWTEKAERILKNT